MIADHVLPQGILRKTASVVDTADNYEATPKRGNRLFAEIEGDILYMPPHPIIGSMVQTIIC